MGTPHISSNRLFSQQLSLLSLLLVPNQAATVFSSQHLSFLSLLIILHPGILFRGRGRGVSINSAEDREKGDLGAVAP